MTDNKKYTLDHNYQSTDLFFPSGTAFVECPASYGYVQYPAFLVIGLSTYVQCGTCNLYVLLDSEGRIKQHFPKVSIKSLPLKERKRQCTASVDIVTHYNNRRNDVHCTDCTNPKVYLYEQGNLETHMVTATSNPTLYPPTHLIALHSTPTEDNTESKVGPYSWMGIDAHQDLKLVQPGVQSYGGVLNRFFPTIKPPFPPSIVSSRSRINELNIFRSDVLDEVVILPEKDTFKPYWYTRNTGTGEQHHYIDSEEKKKLVQDTYKIRELVDISVLGLNLDFSSTDKDAVWQKLQSALQEHLIEIQDTIVSGHTSSEKKSGYSKEKAVEAVENSGSVIFFGSSDSNSRPVKEVPMDASPVGKDKTYPKIDPEDTKFAEFRLTVIRNLFNWVDDEIHRNVPTSRLRAIALTQLEIAEAMVEKAILTTGDKFVTKDTRD